jgi:predicted nuclease of predicted toxin-antitoxin system
MPPPWRFLLDRGVNFRTKRERLRVGFPAVLQLADVDLTGLATDPEIFSEAQQRRFTLITKDTDFIRDVRYALGHDGILYITQSKTEL